MTRPAAVEAQHTPPFYDVEQRRTLVISGLAIIVGVGAVGVARLLIAAIALVTNISFFGKFTAHSVSPADNHLGIWVMIVPVIGGLIVGLMARYGSGAIRGHGIPEAMEQILTTKARSRPRSRCSSRCPLRSRSAPADRSVRRDRSSQPAARSDRSLVRCFTPLRTSARLC